MKKYDVWGRVYGSKFIGTYEAETEDEAIQLAQDDPEGDFCVTVCNQCSDEVEINPDIEDLYAELSYEQN